MPICSVMFFFFNDTATTEIYTLSLHDALPISVALADLAARDERPPCSPAALETMNANDAASSRAAAPHPVGRRARSEEHTSELQSRQYLVCRLLLEKKKNTHIYYTTNI